jgi:hypothetical protein
MTFLTEQEREQFETDGYLIFAPDVPEEAIDSIPRELERKFPAVRDRDDPTHIRVHDAYRYNAQVRALATAPKVLGITIRTTSDTSPGSWSARESRLDMG